MVLPKNPVLVEAGRRGAERRWGLRRVVRLDDLTSEQRRLVLALVDAAKAVKVVEDAT